MRNLILVPLLALIGAACTDLRSPVEPLQPSGSGSHTLAVPGAATLVEDFAGSTIDRNRWNFYNHESWVLQDDRLVVQPEPLVPGYGGLISAQPYPIVGNSFLAEISKVATGSATTETLIALTSTDLEEYAVITSFGGRISAWRKWRGDPAFYRLGSDLKFSATSHRFRRIREADGILHYELSADGIVWSKPKGWSVAHQFSDMSQLHIAVAAGPYQADNANPTAAHFANVNSTVPAIPRNTALTRFSETVIDVAWEDHSVNETGFRIERRPIGGTFAEIAVVGANVKLYRDSVLEENALYEYRVRAYNGSGESAYTGVGVLPDVPSAPADLRANPRSAIRVDLVWTDVANDETGFRIERRQGGGPWSVLRTLGANVISYRDSSGEAGLTYDYRIQAINRGGGSAWSNEATATTYPASPAAFVAAATSATSIQLTWSAGSPADGYNIERSVSGGRFRGLATVPGSATELVDSGLTSGATYSYRIRAFNSSGGSAWVAAPTVAMPVP